MNPSTRPDASRPTLRERARWHRRGRENGAALVTVLGLVTLLGVIGQQMTANTQLETSNSRNTLEHLQNRASVQSNVGAINAALVDETSAMSLYASTVPEVSIAGAPDASAPTNRVNDHTFSLATRDVTVNGATDLNGVLSAPTRYPLRSYPVTSVRALGDSAEGDYSTEYGILPAAVATGAGFAPRTGGTLPGLWDNVISATHSIATYGTFAPFTLNPLTGPARTQSVPTLALYGHASLHKSPGNDVNVVTYGAGRTTQPATDLYQSLSASTMVATFDTVAHNRRFSATTGCATTWAGLQTQLATQDRACFDGDLVIPDGQLTYTSPRATYLAVKGDMSLGSGLAGPTGSELHLHVAGDLTVKNNASTSAVELTRIFVRGGHTCMTATRDATGVTTPLNLVGAIACPRVYDTSTASTYTYLQPRLAESTQAPPYGIGSLAAIGSSEPNRVQYLSVLEATAFVDHWRYTP